VKSRGSQCNETLLVRAAVRPGKKLGLQSAAKNSHSKDLAVCARFSVLYVTVCANVVCMSDTLSCYQTVITATSSRGWRCCRPVYPVLSTTSSAGTAATTVHWSVLDFADIPCLHTIKNNYIQKLPMTW